MFVDCFPHPVTPVPAAQISSSPATPPRWLLPPSSTGRKGSGELQHCYGRLCHRSLRLSSPHARTTQLMSSLPSLQGMLRHVWGTCGSSLCLRLQVPAALTPSENSSEHSVGTKLRVVPVLHFYPSHARTALKSSYAQSENTCESMNRCIRDAYRAGSTAENLTLSWRMPRIAVSMRFFKLYLPTIKNAGKRNTNEQPASL